MVVVSYDRNAVECKTDEREKEEKETLTTVTDQR
jgi:hypothetical protein